mmetsp:Transcript_9377/g.21138  ORF Transcript_9377/g.21138 Transcript_9377/m.21138 type:complete len:1000 (-) Transcript_9377:548-3547(-)
MFVGSYRSDEVSLSADHNALAATPDIDEEKVDEESKESGKEETNAHPLREWKLAIEKAWKQEEHEQRQAAENAGNEEKVDGALLNPHQTFVHDIELANLSPDSIADFIGDALDRTPLDVMDITEAVYKKTLGNIFFVQQALEELVRKNAIYYDIMTFGWQVTATISTEMLEDYLSADAVEMVQSKLQTLPGILQQALAVAAYTRQTFDAQLLIPLMNKSNSAGHQPKVGMAGSLTKKTLERFLRRALDEGLILPATLSTDLNDSSRSLDCGSMEFKASASNIMNDYQLFQFAHDKIREAACASIPEGDSRNQFLWAISTALLELHARLYCDKNKEATNEDNMIDNEDDDWMLFTATGHLNSLPSMTNGQEMAALNLRVGKIAVSKGAFEEALVFFKHGVRRLDPATCWDAKDHPEEYRLTLDLYNLLLECEHTLNHADSAKAAVDQVLTNAATLTDKLRAQYVHVYTQAHNNIDYQNGVRAGLEVLRLYGIDNLPIEPTDKHVRREKFQLRLALRGRPLSCLSKFTEYDEGDFSQDDEADKPLLVLVSAFKIAQITVKHAVIGSMTKVADMLGHRILRLAVTKKVITKNLPFMLMAMSAPLRQHEKYDKALSFANVCQGLMDRFSQEKSGAFVLTRMALYAGLITLRVSFRDAIEVFLECHKGLIAVGDTDPAMGGAMHAMFAFMISSLPLGSLLEPKLLLFEELCENLGKRTFIAIFQLLRQTMYNLRGGRKSSLNPTELAGEAFNEQETLAQFEGGAHKMTLRDVGIFRLMLAVIFNDEQVMMEMLERLEPYPVFDRPVDRQHLRLSYVAFASFILLQKDKENPMLRKWSNLGIQFFQKLARFGSPNAQPVFSCLKALANPSLAAYDQAIQVVSNLGLLNLAGFMNERCGLWLVDVTKNSDSNAGGSSERCMMKITNRQEKTDDFGTDGTSFEDYLKCALWCYYDWGAMQKCVQLQEQFVFLRNATQEKPPSQLSSVRRQAAMLGVPRPGPLSASSM